MTSKDLAFVTTSGVLAAALYVFVLSIASVPAWPFSLVPIVVGLIVFVLRVVVRVVGAENTRIDEALDAVEAQAEFVESLIERDDDSN